MTDGRKPDEPRLARERLSGMRARRPTARHAQYQAQGPHRAVARPWPRGGAFHQDRDITLFSGGLDPQFAGINTFMKSPYVEDIRDIGRYDVAIVGAPFDMGTTYRSSARFGPEAVRRISGVYDANSPDLGMDLLEEITIGDAGNNAGTRGLIGMDLVEIAPPYDVADVTAQMAARLVLDTLASFVESGHLGSRLTREERERAERERQAAAEAEAAR